MSGDGIIDVLMPQMGEGIAEATLVKWLKKTGEKVLKDEPLLEVSTDKVDTEIPSPSEGFLIAVYANNGETVEVNRVIAALGSTADAKPSKAPQPVRAPDLVRTEVVLAQPQGSAPRQPKSKPIHTQVTEASLLRRSSPLVRKMASDLGIDLDLVSGSGLHGRITKADLEDFRRGAHAAAPVAVPAQKVPAHLEYGRLETKKEGGKELLDGVVVRREKMSKMRGLIAEHMVRSVRTSPHVTTIFEIDMHKVVQAREAKKAEFSAREGFNLTYTPFFVYAATQAIRAHPVVNVSIDGEDILWKDEINVGVAVAIESGLIVPVIRNAGALDFLGVARALNDLATRARSKKLTPDDVQGGTFSITNPGMFGSIVSSPIINQPQVAILSIGAIIKRPVVIGDDITVRPLVQLGLTFDHRVVDGEGGAKYLATLKQVLETFDASVI